jgi:hypothetical protein
MRPEYITMLDAEGLKRLEPGEIIVTPFGTGTLLRVGSWCSDICSCGDEPQDCDGVNVPCLHVELDGGGTCWVDYDKCAKA